MKTQTPAAPVAPPLFNLYYWRHGFVMLAPSFVLDRSDSPYRRLSATLLYALENPFTLETGDSGRIVTRAALVAPNVPRRRITAIGSKLLICDIGLATPEFHALSALLAGNPLMQLDPAMLAPLNADIERMHRGTMLPEELQAFIERLIFSVSGQKSAAPKLHPKLLHALQLIDEHSMKVTTLPWLAQQVGLSPSRLRHLFSEQIGSSLKHYLRWTAVWKGGWLWSRGTPLVELAEQVGFHDLAHVNHAFNEIFGVNPSLLFQNGQVGLFRCNWN